MPAIKTPEAQITTPKKIHKPNDLEIRVIAAIALVAIMASLAASITKAESLRSHSTLPKVNTNNFYAKTMDTRVAQTDMFRFYPKSTGDQRLAMSVVQDVYCFNLDAFECTAKLDKDVRAIGGSTLQRYIPLVIKDAR